ncbi:PorP/SprF family type IX secretion system membrane protein [Mucilaginibacter ginkgonis]|uniref:Type IX secretion system membrane protein PorP/SprF n=1 Tax=Mucilaginibacter ginkgonis TaxID=2682091 RepID=A0A6I4IN67_9SPHI|nr:type IX secretion system membrane protein PorP/SprF [Mucilaginibacter ginkgonis]QQL51228.1 type IX secretion system membrane protein PorP/SprF [Mucilaginibacter ginkgonis]
MKIQLTLLLLCFTLLAFGQQDAQQSQYMFNGIYINPAYAGYKENINLHSFYRSQWTGITGSPVSLSLAVDASANDGNVGLALQIANDRIGAQSDFSTYVNYAYRLRLNNDGSSRLALGVGLGAVSLGLNSALLNPNDPEINQPLSNQNVILPDGRIGVFFSNNLLYAGLSADNLVSQYINKNSHPFIAQPKPHYYLTAGYLIPLSKDIYLKPSFLLKDDRAGPTSLDLNAFILFGQKLWLGASYRSAVSLYDKSYLQSDLSKTNSVVTAIEVFPVDNIRIGYAYDISIGPLQGYSSGTHEISIGYYIKTFKRRILTPRYF